MDGFFKVLPVTCLNINHLKKVCLLLLTVRKLLMNKAFGNGYYNIKRK